MKLKVMKRMLSVLCALAVSTSCIAGSVSAGKDNIFKSQVVTRNNELKRSEENAEGKIAKSQGNVSLGEREKHNKKQNIVINYGENDEATIYDSIGIINNSLKKSSGSAQTEKSKKVNSNTSDFTPKNDGLTSGAKMDKGTQTRANTSPGDKNASELQRLILNLRLKGLEFRQLELKHKELVDAISALRKKEAELDANRAKLERQRQLKTDKSKDKGSNKGSKHKKSKKDRISGLKSTLDKIKKFKEDSKDVLNGLKREKLNKSMNLLTEIGNPKSSSTKNGSDRVLEIVEDINKIDEKIANIENEIKKSSSEIEVLETEIKKIENKKDCVSKELKDVESELKGYVLAIKMQIDEFHGEGYGNKFVDKDEFQAEETARNLAKETAKNLAKKNENAKIIQEFCRKTLSMIKKNEAAKEIQKVWRGHNARNNLKKKAAVEKLGNAVEKLGKVFENNNKREAFEKLKDTENGKSDVKSHMDSGSSKEIKETE